MSNETVAPSYDGTLATLRSAVLLPPGAKRGDKLPAIIMMYPDTDLSGDAVYFGGGTYPGEPPLIYTSRGYAVLLTNADMGPGVGTHPWANVFRYIQNSPYYRADKIKTPMLTMQG